jgi:hypothetical protein
MIVKVRASRDKQLPEHINQLEGAERFNEILIRASRPSFQNIRLLPSRCNQNNHGMAQIRIRLDPATHFKSVHLSRHHDV